MTERRMIHSDTTEENARPEEVDALRGRQIAETHHVGATPTTGVLPASMSTGAWVGALVGALIGAVIMVPFSLIPIGGFSAWVRVVWFVVIGLAAGGAFGFVNAAAASAERSPESLDEDPRDR